MRAQSTALFDFSPFHAQRDQAVESIRAFLAHDAFRSAVVEELELDEDFYRRPLRPEDLAILPFSEPIRAENVNCLAALASNRMMLSINELGVARLPRARRGGDEFERFGEFYSDRNQVHAAMVRPFLENFAFGYAGGEARAEESAADYQGRLEALQTEEARFWQSTFQHLVAKDYLQEGLGFILIQRWCLAPTQRVALGRAAASGYFEGLELMDQPRLDASDDQTLAALAESLGVNRRAHSYWQFYLATSLAQTNLLGSLASRPDRALALWGAAFAAEAAWLEFSAGVEGACPHLLGQSGAEKNRRESRKALSERFGRVLSNVEGRFGRQGLHQFGLGLGAAQKLAARARWDLGEQLRWLSAVEQYCELARKVDARVQVECPNIDRETFVEPREMCSTTHVHNDHRLVVIESGDMVFWGNRGMQLKMKVGDMVLIPQGRLHGSTVVSDECTYHQPIIPDDWVRALTRELETEAPAQEARAHLELG